MSVDLTHPFDLPPLPPPKAMQGAMDSDVLIAAHRELAELKGYTMAVPNPLLIISPAILKEAVASSNIENINTTIEAVLQGQLFPAGEQRPVDKEVLRYNDAIRWGHDHRSKYAISTRLITGIARILIPKYEGHYRRDQNKIVNSATGEVRYTPPAHRDIPRLMSNWEQFVNAPDPAVDPLVRCAIAHYQFEAIHPFADGNGRTGRILIVLQLINENILSLPMLYISGYINVNRSEYYARLRAVTTDGAWAPFVEFMLRGFRQQAAATNTLLLGMLKLRTEFEETLKREHRKLYSTDLVNAMFSHPILSPVKLGAILDVHYTTASKYLRALASSGYLSEGKYGKYRLFMNDRLMKMLLKQ